MTPSLTVAICTYNRSALLAQALQALAAQQVRPELRLEVLIVDNNSADRTPAVVNEAAGRLPWPVRYAFEPRQGLNYARNRAVREAQAAYLAFIDDDILPRPDWAQAVYDGLIEWDADLLCGPIHARWEAPPPAWISRAPGGVLGLLDYGPRAFRITDRAHHVFGGNLALRVAVFDHLRGFREDVGPIGGGLLRCGETELFDRALAAGCRIVYTPAAVVSHWIPRRHMTAAYFRQRRYWTGYSAAKIRGPGGAAARLAFGVPRWVLREAFDAAARAAALRLCGRPADAFVQELRVWSLLGYGRGLAERHERAGTPRLATP